MCPYYDAVLYTGINGFQHVQRVTGMKSAGDIGGADVGKNGPVITQCPWAEVFAQIAVDVNGSHENGQIFPER